MSPDTPQPQPGLTLREQVALALARCADNTWAQADAVIPLVAKAQRDESAKALTEYALTYNDAAMSFAAEFVRNLPLISEEGATRD